MKKGFTLIELLVVIAIIGILSSVVLVSLNDARAKARIAQVQGSLNGVTPAAVICMDENKTLVSPSSTTDGGGVVCSGSTSLWPKLATGWTYATPTSSPSQGTFSFSASGDSATVSCSQSGCTKTP